MVRRIRTRVVLGTRETPKFVSKEFYDMMELFTSIYQYDFRLRPTTIRYAIPGHMVVERSWNECKNYEIDIDDALWVPICHRRHQLESKVYKTTEPKRDYDRFQVITEEYSSAYYLLTPNAQFYDTAIFTDWSTKYILHNNIMWRVEMRKVNVDPHNTNHSIWFFCKPRYQVELCCMHDFREKKDELLSAIRAFLPRNYRWDSIMMSG